MSDSVSQVDCSSRGGAPSAYSGFTSTSAAAAASARAFCVVCGSIGSNLQLRKSGLKCPKCIGKKANKQWVKLQKRQATELLCQVTQDDTANNPPVPSSSTSVLLLQQQQQQQGQMRLHGFVRVPTDSSSYMDGPQLSPSVNSRYRDPSGGLPSVSASGLFTVAGGGGGAGGGAGFLERSINTEEIDSLSDFTGTNSSSHHQLQIQQQQRNSGLGKEGGNAGKPRAHPIDEYISKTTVFKAAVHRATHPLAEADGATTTTTTTTGGGGGVNHNSGSSGSGKLPRRVGAALSAGLPGALSPLATEDIDVEDGGKQRTGTQPSTRSVTATTTPFAGDPLQSGRPQQPASPSQVKLGAAPRLPPRTRAPPAPLSCVKGSRDDQQKQQHQQHVNSTPPAHPPTRHSTATNDSTRNASFSATDTSATTTGFTSSHHNLQPHPTLQVQQQQQQQDQLQSQHSEPKEEANLRLYTSSHRNGATSHRITAASPSPSSTSPSPQVPSLHHSDAATAAASASQDSSAAFAYNAIGMHVRELSMCQHRTTSSFGAGGGAGGSTAVLVAANGADNVSDASSDAKKRRGSVRSGLSTPQRQQPPKQHQPGRRPQHSPPPLLNSRRGSTASIASSLRQRRRDAAVEEPQSKHHYQNNSDDPHHHHDADDNEDDDNFLGSSELESEAADDNDRSSDDGDASAEANVDKSGKDSKHCPTAAPPPRQTFAIRLDSLLVRLTPAAHGASQQRRGSVDSEHSRTDSAMSNNTVSSAVSTSSKVSTTSSTRPHGYTVQRTTTDAKGSSQPTRSSAFTVTRLAVAPPTEKTAGTQEKKHTRTGSNDVRKPSTAGATLLPTEGVEVKKILYTIHLADAETGQEFHSVDRLYFTELVPALEAIKRLERGNKSQDSDAVVGGLPALPSKRIPSLRLATEVFIEERRAEAEAFLCAVCADPFYIRHPSVVALLELGPYTQSGHHGSSSVHRSGTAPESGQRRSSVGSNHGGMSEQPVASRNGGSSKALPSRQQQKQQPHPQPQPPFLSDQALDHFRGEKGSGTSPVDVTGSVTSSAARGVGLGGGVRRASSQVSGHSTRSSVVRRSRLDDILQEDLAAVQLGNLLGRGTFGAVYLGLIQTVNGPLMIAVKVLQLSSATAGGDGDCGGGGGGAANANHNKNSSGQGAHGTRNGNGAENSLSAPDFSLLTMGSTTNSGNRFSPLDGSATFVSQEEKRWQSGGDEKSTDAGVSETATTGTATAGLTVEQTDEFRVLLSELEILRRTRHRNVARFLGSIFDRKSATLRVFTEYVECGTIQSLVKKFGAMPLLTIQSYMKQMLAGLRHLHDLGIAHRDIKGENVLVNKNGRVKLSDFGCSSGSDALAGSAASSSSSAAFSLPVGTPLWMAPEVIAGEVEPPAQQPPTAEGRTGNGDDMRERAMLDTPNTNPARFAGDVWALGCVGIEMLDRALWNYNTDNISAFVIMFKIAHARCPPHGLPSEVELQQVKGTGKEEEFESFQLYRDFLLKCFIRDPRERWTAAQLQRHPFLHTPFSRTLRWMPPPSPTPGRK